MRIMIDGERWDVDEVYTGGYLPMVRCGRCEFYVAESEEAAGKAARRRWKDLAEDDPEEFACLVGQETLVAWALGQYAGPGSTSVRSLEEWLDLWLDSPEEEFASYDGASCDVERWSKGLREELGFVPRVAYRNN